MDSDLTATEIAMKSMKIAASIDIYTNGNYTMEVLAAEPPPDEPPLESLNSTSKL